MPVALRPGSILFRPNSVSWSRGSRVPHVFSRVLVASTCAADAGSKPVSTHGFQGSAFRMISCLQTLSLHCDGSNTSAPRILHRSAASFGATVFFSPLDACACPAPTAPPAHTATPSAAGAPSLRFAPRDDTATSTAIVITYGSAFRNSGRDRHASRLQREAQARERAEQVGADEAELGAPEREDHEGDRDPARSLRQAVDPLRRDREAEAAPPTPANAPPASVWA